MRRPRIPRWLCGVTGHENFLPPPEGRAWWDDGTMTECLCGWTLGDRRFGVIRSLFGDKSEVY